MRWIAHFLKINNTEDETPFKKKRKVETPFESCIFSDFESQKITWSVATESNAVEDFEINRAQL